MSVIADLFKPRRLCCVSVENTVGPIFQGLMIEKFLQEAVEITRGTEWKKKSKEFLTNMKNFVEEHKKFMSLDIYKCLKDISDLEEGIVVLTDKRTNLGNFAYITMEQTKNNVKGGGLKSFQFPTILPVQSCEILSLLTQLLSLRSGYQKALGHSSSLRNFELLLGELINCTKNYYIATRCGESRKGGTFEAIADRGSFVSKDTYWHIRGEILEDIKKMTNNAEQQKAISLLKFCDLSEFCGEMCQAGNELLTCVFSQFVEGPDISKRGLPPVYTSAPPLYPPM